MKTIHQLTKTALAAGIASILLTGCYQQQVSSEFEATGVEASLQLVQSGEQSVSILDQLKTFDDKALDIDHAKVTHLVFMNIWDSYTGAGAETQVAQLPEHYLQRSQQIWVQPEINVTQAQMAEFQDYYPDVAPLVLDQGFQLMHAYQVWQSPYHILLQGDKTLFSGDFAELKNYLGVTDTKPAKSELVAEVLAQEQASLQPSKHYRKLAAGDLAPNFNGITLQGKAFSLDQQMAADKDKPVSLVFLDSLCPMPHFPGCEDKLNRLSQTISSARDRHWVGVMSSFYVDQSIASQFAERFSLTLPLVFDTGNQIFEQYGVHGTPYQIDINPQGVIQSRGDTLR
ncbi:peroxiredoxin family protein [Oceanospirillum beijerinckii]|uniref:peroxiredoxin family protein n=1 Tax=Oceanospirillum beijerinckii TaxID=64976 RepID=UPI0003F8124B|nr:redoxin domain-containing protein [Oceanospirillum beijerinckii]